MTQLLHNTEVSPCDTTSAYFNQIRLNLARLLQDEVVPFSHDLPLPGIKKKKLHHFRKLKKKLHQFGKKTHKLGLTIIIQIYIILNSFK